MTTIEHLLQAALREVEAGQPAILETVVSAEGSTPRAAGALMLSGPAGLLAGTIGGGALEHRCLQLAAELPPTGPGRVENFVLDNRQAGSLGMVCGGSARVLFTPLADPVPLRLCLESLSGSQPGWLCLPLDGSAPLVGRDDSLPQRPAVVDWQGCQVLAVPLADAGRVFLLGGGHVALELAALLDRLEFRYLVADDRPEFSSAARFPGAERALVLPFPQLASALDGSLAPGEADGFCIMTRGHEWDTEALRFALSTPAGYIGVMGSRRKREAVFTKLEAEGFSGIRDRVTTPIGLEIGAQTPAEIAVSIAGQLIQWRASRR